MDNEADNCEQKLLNLIKNHLSSQKGDNIIEKIKDYEKSSFGNPKKEIFEALKYFLEPDEDNIIKNDLLGFKQTICEFFIDSLSNENYQEGDLDRMFISLTVDSKLRKRKKFASLFFTVTLFSEYKFFFIILNDKKFKLFKKIYDRIDCLPFDSFQDFNEKFNSIKEESLDLLINSPNQIEGGQITNLFNDINNLTEYIQGPKSILTTEQKEGRIKKHEKKKRKKKR